MQTKNVLTNGKRINKVWTEIKRHRLYYIFIFPAVLWYLVFHYYPMYGVIIAFKDFNYSLGILKSPFVQPLFKYFIRFFTYFEFGSIMRNTIIISMMKTVLGFPFPIIFALMINEVKFTKAKKIIQTVSYLPNFISWVVIVTFMQQLLSLDGFINNILGVMGFERQLFMNNPDLFYPIVFFSNLWKSIGFSSIIYLAAISSIEQSMYEAAEIDGAKRLQKIMYITIPEIIPTATLLFILSLSSILHAGFDQIWLLRTPGNIIKSQILDTYVFQIGLLQGQFSDGAAVGLVSSLFGLILILLTNKLSKKVSGISLF